MVTRQEIGQNIRRVRESRGITREKLVEMIGDEKMSISTLQRIELGSTKISTELLHRIAAALKTDFNELVEVSGPRSFVRRKLKDLEEEPEKEEYYLDMQRLFYPDLHYDGILDWRKYPIKSLAEFVIYLPLIDEAKLAEALWRLGGMRYGNEDYLLNQLKWLYSTIPQSDAKAYADYMAKKMNYEDYIRFNFDDEAAGEFIRKEFKMTGLSRAYEEKLEEQYRSCLAE